MITRRQQARRGRDLRGRGALLLGLAACWAAPAPALDPGKAFHHYVQDTWSIEQGLPQITATALAQDADGYLWVGTQAGVARFDGARFVSWNSETEPALPGMQVHALLAEPDGALWIGTYKGLARHEAGVFTAVPASRPDRYPALDVQALAHRADGSVLAATTQGVFVVRDGALHPALSLPGPTHALLERGSTLWVGTRGGVVQVDALGSTLLPLSEEAADAAVTRLVQAQGRLWAGSSRGLFWRDGTRWRRFADHAALAEAPIDAMAEDGDGNLWVATYAGLARLRDGALAEWIPDDAPAAHRAVRAILEDREGNLWLGSQWEGVARLWNGWTRRYSVQEGLHEPLLWSLARAEDGRVWTGTSDGLAVFEDGRFRRVLRGDELPHPHAYTLLDEGERLWIGTRRGLAVLENGRVSVPAWSEPIASAQVNGVLRRRDGSLWFATTTGAYRLANGALQRLAEDAGLADPRIRLLFEDADGELLVATQLGLYRFDGARMQPVGAGAGLPPGIDVTAIHQLADGTRVIGTLAERVFIELDGRWHDFGVEHGLPVNSPFFITDADGWLWIAGIRGIGRAPLAAMLQRARGGTQPVPGEMLLNERGDRRSGQKGYCCNGAGLAKGFFHDGELWLPTRDGIATMAVDGIVKNTQPPTLRIERVRANGEWLLADQVAGHNLSSNLRDLLFEFTALSFQDPQSVRLRYRLRGYDADWRELDDPTRRTAGYTNLPPGPYVFEVEGANNADVWAAEPARLEFAIHRRFHESAGFLALMVLGAGLLVWGLLRWRTGAIAAQREALAGEVRRRTRELERVNRQLAEASQTDPLTGLRNRRYLAEQLPADLAFYAREALRADREPQVMLFAMVDIDHFKEVNDRHGHNAGDRVLQQFAVILEGLVRGSDYIVRWGGEEFLLVFRPMPDRHISVIGERIRRAMAAHAFDLEDGTRLHLTCSVGMAEFPLPGDNGRLPDWLTLVELADRALYWVKRQGRNGWAALRPKPPGTAQGLVAAIASHGIEAVLDAGEAELLGSAPAAD